MSVVRAVSMISLPALPADDPVKVAIVADGQSRVRLSRLVEAAAGLKLQDGDPHREPGPDVIVIDLEATRDGSGPAQLVASIPDAAMVVLADQLPDTEVAELLVSGVVGLIAQTASNAQILAAIRCAAAGLMAVAPELFPLQLPDRQSGTPSASTADASGEALTQRESEVLNLLALGLSNKEIAQRLRISDHTVKYHLTSVFAKLGVSRRTEAVMLGIQRGIVLL